MKDKWNTKSIYVVGKATAALGELLSHYENTSLLKSFFLLLFSIFVVCAFFFINPCYVNANSSRVWQAPGVVVTEVCEVMLPP